MYIAADKNGDIYLHELKPVRVSSILWNSTGNK